MKSVVKIVIKLVVTLKRLKRASVIDSELGYKFIMYTQQYLHYN